MDLQHLRKVVRIGEEIFAAFGCPTGQAAPEEVEDFTPAASANGVPEKVDLRKYCTEVEDQRQSNSCCANAVAGAYEYLAKKAAAANGDEVGDISRMFIYYVGRKSDLASMGRANCKVKDEGMSITGAINALKCKGACLEKDWPFDLEAVNNGPPEDLYQQAMDYKISNGINIPVDLETMQKCLADGYPFVFGLKLTARFFRPGSRGVIATPNLDDPQSASHGLHAMLCVGYSNADQCFIVRNSWGPNWGHGGYCYVPYEYMANSDFNFCGQYAIKGLSDYDLTPEEDELGDGNVIEEGEDDGEDEPELGEEDVDVGDYEESDNEYDDMFDKHAEVKRVFARFDTDGSGTLSRSELQRAIACMGVYLPRFMISGLSKKYNDDGSPGLSLDEFTECLVDLGLTGL